MEEQFGAKFMQFTLRLEGCCLIGPWRWAGGFRPGWACSQTPPRACLFSVNQPYDIYMLVTQSCLTNSFQPHGL